MLQVCWSPKGGSGTSVVAAAIAVQSAARGNQTRLVDLAGDQDALFGAQVGDGIGDWFAAADEVGVEALRALEVELAPKLGLIGRGVAPAHDWSPERMALALTLFHHGSDVVVVDAGRRPPGGCPQGVGEIVVVRACYLGLRRLEAVRRDHTRLVVIEEPGRALSRHDMAAAVGEIDVVIPWDAAVARAVDAGLLASRVPRSLRPLRALVDSAVGSRR